VRRIKFESRRQPVDTTHREKRLFRAFARGLSIISVNDLAGQNAGAPNVYFAIQTIRFNTLSGPYDYNPGSRFVLVQPSGADLLVRSLDTQVQMVVSPSCVTNDPEVARQAWRTWMEQNGLLAQYEQKQREIAQELERKQQEKIAAARRAVEQERQAEAEKRAAFGAWEAAWEAEWQARMQAAKMEDLRNQVNQAQINAQNEQEADRQIRELHQKYNISGPERNSSGPADGA
jgi:hypothetical protein